ncbi:hypothetical protein H6F42_09415 [Pseudanabaena sp. FACHB-1998]|nr:hypothetical protein [Pseudanabaena sp. FACHB-1998]
MYTSAVDALETLLPQWCRESREQEKIFQKCLFLDNLLNLPTKMSRFEASSIAVELSRLTK